jgi:DNA-binding transcriptional regulator YhcF (GntR family)
VFDERSPIYQQIADQIRQEIATGALAEGEQVMSTNRYAAFHRINPATVAKGFKQLIDEGVLHKRRGIGMFVSPDAREMLVQRRRERFFETVFEPMIDEARLVGVSLDEILRRIEKLRERGGA